jgi:L-seryl-tRNA(Ser) seleniumtransferase
MLTEKQHVIAARADECARQLAALANSRLTLDLVSRPSKAGGGALPLLELPSRCIRMQVEGLSVNSLERRLRQNEPPIIGRIEDDSYIMDMRTIHNDEIPFLVSALVSVLKTL